MLLRCLDSSEFQGPYIIRTGGPLRLVSISASDRMVHKRGPQPRSTLASRFRSFSSRRSLTEAKIRLTSCTLNLTVHHGTSVMFLTLIPQNASLETFAFAYQTHDTARTDVQSEKPGPFIVSMKPSSAFCYRLLRLRRQARAPVKWEMFFKCDFVTMIKEELPWSR